MIDELAPAPQSQDAASASANDCGIRSNNDDLLSLVRSLADQAKASDERLAASDKRLAASDKRSAELAERVALLEGELRHDTAPTSTVEPAEKKTRSSFGRLRSTRVTIAKRQDEPLLSDNDVPTHSNTTIPTAAADASEHLNGLRSVRGIPEDDPNEALSDRVLLIEERLESYDEEKTVRDKEECLLPESTFSLLITHPPTSIPFMFAAFSMVLSISCLALTLARSLQKGTKGNLLGIPGGVSTGVRVAQFLGVIVGVLMEDEIPQGLQLIANGAGHTLLLNGKNEVQMKVIISSIFRLIVGYLFLLSLLINVAQNSDVISIFYDVLALEFVENIDDTTYALAKRGFFGRDMLLAANTSYNLERAGRDGTRDSVSFRGEDNRNVTERRLSSSGLMTSHNRVNQLLRCVYFFNAAVLLSWLGYITVTQERGLYRCNSISVLFDEVIWENAYVNLTDGSVENRLLIYSYFNGIYKEEGGQHDGYPKYVEQNKEDGTSFGDSVTGAEIVYCADIGSWVFRHPDILTAPMKAEQNECGWLWKSPQTEDYDILSATEGSWKAWVGEVQPLARASITCNQCSERSDCNYHGTCNANNECVCNDSHFGESCEFEFPCTSLASEKSHTLDPAIGIQWDQEIPIKLWHSGQTKFHRVYNRPVYIQKGLSGQPFDMRLYKILEKEKSPLPSTTPSNSPSVSNRPTQVPTQFPSYPPTFVPTPIPTRIPTPAPTTRKPSNNPTPSTLMPTLSTEYTSLQPTPWVTDGSTPTVGILKTAPPTPYPTESSGPTSTPTTSLPTKPLHIQKEYDTAPDFADWDDFFESPHMHDLKDILEDYSVIISYSGSRFFGKIIEPDASLDRLFPPDYHAFWVESFDLNRTFIISDTTSTSTPVGIDFFEMRRRINSMLDPSVKYQYGPFGALIPLMDYQGTGFFHCLDETLKPGNSSSSFSVPTQKPPMSP